MQICRQTSSHFSAVSRADAFTSGHAFVVERQAKKCAHDHGFRRGCWEGGWGRRWEFFSCSGTKVLTSMAPKYPQHVTLYATNVTSKVILFTGLRNETTWGNV